MPAVEPAYRYRATVNRVVDADTLLLDIDLGFRVNVAIPIRVRGVNAPELRTEEGERAREWAVQFLHLGKIVVETYRDRRSFERWVADVYVDGEPLADALIEAGHGVAV